MVSSLPVSFRSILTTPFNRRLRSKPRSFTRWAQTGSSALVLCLLLSWSLVGRAQSFNPNGVTVAGGNGQGTGTGQLDNPQSIYVDAAGNVYIADKSSARIQRWAPGATQGVTVAGGNGSGTGANQLSGPEGVYVDTDGTLYVSEDGNNRVTRWVPGASQGVTVAGGNGYGSGANQVYGPQGIYVDKAGNLYVAEYYNDRVTRWAPGATQGVTVAGDGSYGSGPGQLAGPTDVGMDAAGNLFVLENGNSRVTRWAPGATQGVTVAGGNGRNSGANQLSYPEGFYVDATGNVYIADTGNNRVQLWTPGATQGVTVAGGNGTGSGANQLNRPLDIWINTAGDLYVSDRFNYRVQRFDKIVPSLTDLQANPNPVCSGQPASFTATVGQTTGMYSYTLNNGVSNPLTGTASSASFNQSLTATGSGPQAYTLTVTTPAGYSATASVSLTVIARPAAPGVSNLTYCQNAVASVLTASGSRLRWYDASGNPLPEAPRPATNQVGSTTYYVTQANDSGCESERAALTVTVKPTPSAPTLVTQSGGSYPSGQSSLTISQNTGNVILTVSGCQGGSISWQGGNSTTLAVSTANTGSQSFTASCTLNGCTSPTATATVTVVAPTLKVLSRDPDNGQLGNNTIKPYLLLQNAGTTPIPYSTITLRYWLTTENNIPLIFQKNYVAIGQGNLNLRYVALNPARQGATGYIEYSFTAGAGSLAPNGDSGPLEVQASKQDYSRFVQSDDYSYINNSSFTLNARITAYQNGVIFYGTEPSGTGSTREAVGESGNALSVKVLGNPVVGSSAEVEISGASGQTVQLKLVDLQGKLINGHSIKEAGLVERVSLPLSNVQGMLLLEVSTATHRQQIKLLRP